MDESSNVKNMKEATCSMAPWGRCSPSQSRKRWTRRRQREERTYGQTVKRLWHTVSLSFSIWFPYSDDRQMEHNLNWEAASTTSSEQAARCCQNNELCKVQGTGM